MKIIDCIQGSEEWCEARRGRPTASRFSEILKGEEVQVKVDLEAARAIVRNGTAPGMTAAQVKELAEDVGKATKARKYAYYRGYNESNAQESYIAELISERSDLGWQEFLEYDYSGSPDLQRGRELEAEARNWFAFEQGVDLTEVGICLSDCERYGASPDAMTPAGEPVELKCPRVKTHIRNLLKYPGQLPPDYKAQVHGQILVTGASRGWFMSYIQDDDVKPILIEVPRDDFTERLGLAVEEFCRRLEDAYPTTRRLSKQ